MRSGTSRDRQQMPVRNLFNAQADRCRTFAPTLFALSLAGSLLAGTQAASLAQSPADKSDRIVAHQMASKPASGWMSVILKLDGPLTSEDEAHIQALGGDIYRRLPIIRSVAVRLPARNLSRLAALPFVQHLSADGSVKKNDAFTVGSSGASTAWQQYGLSGYGVTVAIVDSGIHNTPDLNWPSVLPGSAHPSGQRLLASVSFAPKDNSTDDKCGHGTHVAGIVAGDGQQSTGSQYYRSFYGIAPLASLVNVRVLDGQGQGTVSSVISGIQWVVTNKSKYNIRVMNLSLGHPVGESYTTDPLCQAVEQAWQSGIVVVCAAGNSGRLSITNTPGMDNEGWGSAYGSIESPGNDPYVITVGATKSEDGNRADDRIATYSSRGPSRLDLVLKPDIVAPGNRVISLDANNSYLDNYAGGTNDIPNSAYMVHGNNNASNTYYCLSGTSMATPVVSGAAALLLQANPNLSPDTIKARLMISADKWTLPDGTADPCTFGAGYLNIPAALNCTAVATQSALSPSLSEDSLGNVYINMDKAIWGTGINDLHAIWGKSSIADSNANLLNASKAIWGTSVWSDKAIWGTSTSSVDLTSTAIQGEN